MPKLPIGRNKVFQQGQTLIILLVIVAILMALFITQMGTLFPDKVLDESGYLTAGDKPNETPQTKSIGSIDRAKDVEIKNDINQIAQALELYKIDHQQFPPSLAALVPQYLAVLKKNPSSQQDYGYTLNLNGKYTLSTFLTSGEKYEKTSP